MNKRGVILGSLNGYIKTLKTIRRVLLQGVPICYPLAALIPPRFWV